MGACVCCLVVVQTHGVYPGTGQLWPPVLSHRLLDEVRRNLLPISDLPHGLAELSDADPALSLHADGGKDNIGIPVRELGVEESAVCAQLGKLPTVQVVASASVLEERPVDHAPVGLGRVLSRGRPRHPPWRWRRTAPHWRWRRTAPPSFLRDRLVQVTGLRPRRVRARVRGPVVVEPDGRGLRRVRDRGRVPNLTVQFLDVDALLLCDDPERS
mmetsp:Transcript_46298/g.132011  ORF Transcript_46298/g.132011 Transcript_46298/m.132011 type:complete len:214 (-) Transcript_46298:130-771(-)